jgi:flagellar biogenesis protein FliO
VSRTVYLSGIAWALLLCAQVHLGYAGSPGSPDTTATTDGRLTQLAQKLAAASSDSQATDPAIAKTSLMTPGKRTPLLRRGSAAGAESPDTDRADPASGLLKTMTSLGVVIGLILLARFGYARLGGKVASASSPVVEVLSRTTVAPRSHVMLLRVGGRVLVVSDSSAGMRTLASVEDAQEVAELLGAVSAAKPNSITRSFGQMFHRADEEYDIQQAQFDQAQKPTHDETNARQSLSGLLSKVRGLGKEGGGK